MVAANEKPMIVSSSVAPAWTPAATIASGSANASPTISSLTISIARSPASCPTGWPCIATGVSASEIATAIANLTRAGIIRDEKPGASTNRPPTRDSTSRKPIRLEPASPVSWMASPCTMTPPLRSDHRRDRGIEGDGVAHHLIHHPGAGEQDDDAGDEHLGDERQRLLLDLRHRLEDGDQQADGEAGDQE